MRGQRNLRRLAHDGMCWPRLLLRRSGKCSSLCACEGEADKVTKGAWELPVLQQLCWHASPHFSTSSPAPPLSPFSSLGTITSYSSPCDTECIECVIQEGQNVTAPRGRGRGSLSRLIPPGWSPAPSGSRVRRRALKQSRRHLDMLRSPNAEFISVHNSSLQYSAHYPSLLSLHSSSASLVRFISSHPALSFPLSRLPSRALSSYSPACRGINQTINVTAIYIGNVICKKLISTLHLYICSHP